MTRICWWFVDLVSRMLDPDEREAVRGDFVESGESGGHALRGVLVSSIADFENSSHRIFM
jgi:hypothetical protein